MITTSITITKITKALELICSLYQQNLITESYIIGSVANGTAKEDSDTDIYLINPDFEKQKDTHNIYLFPEILLENDDEKNK